MDRIWLVGVMPGAVGGLSAFAYSLRFGRITRKNCVARFIADLLGGGTLGFGAYLLLGVLFKDGMMMFAAFSIGASWTISAEAVRAFVQFEIARALREFRRVD